MPKFPATVRRAKFWWHLTIAYLKRYQLRILIVLSILIVSTYFLYSLSPNILRNNVVAIGFIGSYKLDTIPSDILTLVTEPLITKEPNGKYVPALASHWTVSEDGKKYVVFLKDNLHWHDSSLVEAKDISLAISNVQISAINNKTIEFTLPNPIASFPQVLDTPVFKAESFYGTGEFRIVNISQIDEFVKKIVLHPKNDNLPSVEIKFYPTENQAINALKIGEIKVLSATGTKELNTWKNLNITKLAEKNEVVTIFYNTKDPQLVSHELRQALSHAISKEGFDGEVANSPISSSSWAYNSAVKNYDYNVSKGKELVAKAQLKDKKLTLSYATGLDKTALRIKNDWQAIGLDVDIKEEKGIPKNFQALLAINKLPTDPDQYTLWHSTQDKTNITRYVNKRVDKLLEDARVTLKEDERKALYAAFQEEVVNDAPATFLYYPYKYKASYKNIKKLLDKLPQLN